MCNNNCSWIWIIIILLFFCGGCGNNSCGNNGWNNNGCGC